MKISEASVHKSAVKAINGLFATRYPKYLVNGKAPFMHPASGEIRNIRTAVKLKAMNVIPGYPDLLFDLPRGKYYGLRLELKKPKTATQQKGYLSPAQKEWKVYFETYCNIKYVICYSVQDVIDCAINYMEEV